MRTTKALAIIVLAVSAAGLLGCSKIGDGKIVTCKNCGEEVSNSVQYVEVPFWEAGKYEIVYEEGYCVKCGNEEVEYEVTYVCESCGKEYKTKIETALRKAEKEDERLESGTCSTACEIKDGVTDFGDAVTPESDDGGFLGIF
ncbi:MAG: hypothetical protein GY771_06010 [bacterium]|nr:hypothetical protein [bacterium]